MSEEFSWHFVTYDEVHALHAGAIATYGGELSGVRDGCVEQCVDGSRTAAMYASDDGSDLLSAASYLLIYLARNHCFTDGNKRVAWMSMVRLLALNNIRVEAAEEAAARLTEAAATGKIDADGVIQWLATPGRLVGGGLPTQSSVSEPTNVPASSTDDADEHEVDGVLTRLPSS